MEINYDKLLLAIELIAYNKLDECRDDTLIEKLVTNFDLAFNDLKCSNEQLNSIFNLCKVVIELWINKLNELNQTNELNQFNQINDHQIFIGPIFSFIFKLISLNDVQNLIDKTILLDLITKLLNLKDNIFKCDYSIQSYYIKGLIKLFSNNNGSKIVFDHQLINYQFVDKLIYYGLNSKSFFVKESIQQCLIELIRRICEFNDDLIIIKYFQLILSSLEFKLNKFQIKIINQLLNEQSNYKLKNLFPNLNQDLISHINRTDDHINLKLIEFLANNLENNEQQINFIFTKLIKNNLLKPLIVFSSNLAIKNKEYLNKWFIYVILPLEIECKLTTINQLNYFQYTSIDKQIVSSLIDDKSLIYSIYYLKIQFPNTLTINQLNQIIQILNQFINYLIKNNKIKLLKESILMIGNLSKQINDIKLFIIIIDLLINLLWSTKQLQCECLIWLRNLFNNNHNLMNNNKINNQIINLIDNLLNLELKDDNLDLIDGGLELIEILIKTKQLNKLNDNNLKLILKICQYSTIHSDNYSLKATCIVILFNLYLIDNDKLNLINQQQQFLDQTNLIDIIWKCLKDENSIVRRKLIESIKDTILDNELIKNELIHKLIDNNGKLYLDICYYLSESILFEIDSDIQLISIEFLKNFIINFMNINIELIIKLKGLIYFIHSIHFIITNNLICFTIKEQSIKIIELIRNYLNQNLINQQNIINILKDQDLSIFKYKIDDFNRESKSNLNQLNKDDQLNEMFKDNLFRTEEIIANFTNERIKLNSSSNLIEQNKSTNQILIINQTEIKNLLEFLYTFNLDDYLNNEIKIDFLDDILAAKANDDVIIDCY